MLSTELNYQETQFLTKFHDKLQQSTLKYGDFFWVSQSQASLTKELKWSSQSALTRMLERLETRSLVIAIYNRRAKHSPQRKTKWYRINYHHPAAKTLFKKILK